MSDEDYSTTRSDNLTEEQESSINVTVNAFEGTNMQYTLALRITSPADSVATFDQMSDDQAPVNDLSEVSENSYVRTHQMMVSLFVGC